MQRPQHDENHMLWFVPWVEASAIVTVCFPNPRLIYSVYFSSISSVRQDRKVTVQYKIWTSHTKLNLRVVRRNVFSTDWFVADRSFDLEDSQQISPWWKVWTVLHEADDQKCFVSKPFSAELTNRCVLKSIIWHIECKDIRSRVMRFTL